MFMLEGKTEHDLTRFVADYITLYNGDLNRFKQEDAWFAEYWARTPTATVVLIENKFAM